MSEQSTQPSEATVQACEEVRAFLVALRGGGPFLSGADARLLVEWLDQGVPVSAILAAIEAAADRRARRGVRTRLSLSSCQGELKRRLKKLGSAPLPAIPAAPTAPGRAWPALAALAEEIRSMPVDPALVSARAALADALATLAQGRDLSGSPLGDPSDEQVARQAIRACRAFHEASWREATEEREALLAAARNDLSALADVLSEEALTAAAEEVARDRLRGRTPLVSAVVVWDRLVGG